MRRWMVLLFLGLAACGQPEAPPPGSTPLASKPTVYGVNYPLAWAAAQLVGDAAEVVFPAPADVDPAYWTPDLETLAAYQQADLILLNGAGYAKWIDRVSLPQNRLLDSSRVFADQYIEVDGGPVHSHGPEGEHSHGELAFTLWLDLRLYARQVETIADALQKLLPEDTQEIEARRTALLDRIKTLDVELERASEQLGGVPVLYSHPVYQYFDRRYAINGLALHWEPDVAPSPADWSALDTILEGHPATFMIWEAEPMAVTRARLAQRGITVIALPPMGNRPDEGDFISQLQAASAALAAAAATLRPQASTARRQLGQRS